MAAIDSVDHFNDAEMRCVTEMKPYTVRWGFGLNNREFSVILPADTKYKRGLLTSLDKDGFIQPPRYLMDSSSTICVLSSGVVNITFTSKAKEIKSNEIVTGRHQALIFLSNLPENMSKEAFLNGLKKKDVQVLSESEDSLLTKAKTARIFSKAYDETVVKTIVSGQVVFKIQMTTLGGSSDASLYQLFNKIRIVPQDRPIGLFPKRNSFLGENFLKRYFWGTSPKSSLVNRS